VTNVTNIYVNISLSIDSPFLLALPLDMTTKQPSTPVPRTQAKQQKRADALRENLLKRKQQARERKEK
jgi:hypothetical protein